jgi:hypothetical protein
MEWLWTTLLMPMLTVTALGLAGLTLLAFVVDRAGRRC